MSQRLIADVKPTPAAALAKRARQLASEGVDVVNFASGDVDFPGPEPALDAAIRSAQLGPVSYTNVDGEPSLKSTIANAFHKQYGIEVTEDRVIVSTGSKQSIFSALFVTTEPGDEVIVPAPYWSSYLDISRLVGCNPVIASCSPSSDYKLTAEAFERAISDRTKWLILTNPSSPVGSVYRKSELLSLCKVLLKYPQVRILSDELYEAFVFDGAAHVSIASVLPEIADRIVTISGVSKSYAMMGWRIGWAIGDPTIIRNMSTLQSQVTSSASTIGQAAANAALKQGQEHRTALASQVGMNRRLAIDALTNVRGLRIAPSLGSIYLYVDLSTFSKEDRALSERLLNETGVVVLPGSDCGLSPFFRMNIARRQGDLHKGLKRMVEFFSTYSGSY